MRNSCLALVLIFFCVNSWATVPSDKRIIYTSGSKVNLIRYQLGLSTILFFGSKPETVICGNKNYFNIEKIKEGITIQPLSNFSTNLTVINGDRQYLFYLMPAGSARPDGLVDVRWVSPNETRSINTHTKEVVREINQKVSISREVEITIVREIFIEGSKRKIWELNLRNLALSTISASDIRIVASQGGVPFKGQTSVWETDAVLPQKNLRGRVIVSQINAKAVSLSFGFRGKNIKIIVKNSGH